MEKQVKIIAGYLVNNSITNDVEITQYIENLQTYINQIEKLYIYCLEQVDITKLLQRLNKFEHIEIAKVPGYGEAEIYKALVEKAIEDNIDFVTVMKPELFFENEAFLELKKYVMQADVSRTAVITPMPLFGCEIHERKAEEFRAIKGCRLYGALLNTEIYKQTRGIKAEYYQTTYDYDYCLQARHLGYNVMLAQNLALRNQKYVVITRKFGFLTLSAYSRDIMDVYYETRNRLYLWDEYKKIDPEYISIDKKMFKKEKQEIRTRDKSYKQKFIMMDRARMDYKKGILGKFEE